MRHPIAQQARAGPDVQRIHRPLCSPHDDLLGRAHATPVKANLQSGQVTEALIPLNATERAESYLLTSYLATLKRDGTQRLLDQNETLADLRHPAE